MAHEQRKLAAIVATDVVGYSCLMGRDESRTLARLHAIPMCPLSDTLMGYRLDSQ